jgi:hypothetical protein
MIRFVPTIAFTLCAASASVCGAERDDVVKFGATTSWSDMIMETCEPAEADLRILVSVRTDWLGREVVEMPLRLVPLDDESKDVIQIDPVVMVYTDKEKRRAVSVQLGSPSRKGFFLRITAREGGQEVAVPRFDSTFECRWRSRQFPPAEGAQVNVVIALGPRPEKA